MLIHSDFNAPLSKLGKIPSARGGDVPIERRRRDPETVCDLSDADVGIGQHRLGGLDVVVGEFWRATSARPRSRRRKNGQGSSC